MKIEQDPEKIIDKISNEKLVKILKYASDMYYNQESNLSDDTYDFLESVLRKRNPKNPYFQKNMIITKPLVTQWVPHI